MKGRFALFVYSDIDRRGGWGDYCGIFETPSAAHEAMGSSQVDEFYDIVDLDSPEHFEHGIVPKV